MTMEELRVICKYMGWPTQTFNDEDCIKIMVKCGISISPDNSGDGWYVTVFDTDISIHELSTDDEEDTVIVRRLICKAAYEDLKEK